MLKKLEVISTPGASSQSEELYLYHDDNWDRWFVLTPSGKKGACRVRCDWGSAEGVELVFSSLAEAREEIDRLAQYPREWFERVLCPARVVNG